MESLLDALNGKSKRRLSYLWKILLNPTNYLIPETFEDYKSKSFAISVPTIKLEGTECYLNDKAQKECRNFANIIYEIPEIRDTLTYNTIYDSILNEIETEIRKQLKHSKLREFDLVLKDLSVKILEKRRDYTFFFSISGIELKDVSRVNFGTSELFLFKQADKEDLIQSMDAEIEEDSTFTKNVTKFIEKRFLEKVCIKCASFGDFRKAEEIARTRGRQILNLLRFIVCVLFHSWAPENLIKINFTSETYAASEPLMSVESLNGAVTMGWEHGRKTVQSLTIDNQLLDNLKKNIFFKDINEIINALERTEVESILLTAIHWAGEAQNEFDKDVAFIKYWTALESIFSQHSSNITHTLGKGVSILAAFGGYRFIKHKEIREVYKAIKDLYSIRSTIIHRGLGKNVEYSALSSICKYTAWTILGLLHLRSIGYNSMVEIENETCRLFKINAPDL
ncbi:MAG: hypothetical protein H8D56_03455 [Planctomycetes bacterium]|nr:hypothetical protein [Planctomycetota bacterium]MBL7146744.1 hypothetical protein [Phycisphaerae bacterium]